MIAEAIAAACDPARFDLKKAEAINGVDAEDQRGLDGKLIDFGKETEMPARELISEMLQWFVDTKPMADSQARISGRRL